MHHDGVRVGGRGGLLQLAGTGADQGVDDGVQHGQLLRVGEHDRAQLGPVQTAVPGEHLLAERLDHGGEPLGPGATTSRAIRSASTSTAPHSTSSRDTSLLPAPIPPVRPTFSMAAA